MRRSIIRGAGVALALTGLAGCALLPSGSAARREHIYQLAPPAPTAPVSAADCGAIQVAAGPAAVGHRGSAMVYTQDNYELKYFAYARWADTPTRMLSNALRTRLRASGAFSGVLDAPVVTLTDYQVEIADAAVRQHFSGATAAVHMGFELRVFDGDRRELLASEQFVTSEPAAGNPESGVAAASAGAARLLDAAVDYVLATCRKPPSG